MMYQTNVKRDIAGNVLCVSGLSFMMIGFFILTDKYDLSIALGFVIGSTASILYYFLHVLTIRIFERCNLKKGAPCNYIPNQRLNKVEIFNEMAITMI